MVIKLYELDNEDQQLIDAATIIIKENFRPHWITVGAAVNTPSGEIFQGVNIDTCGYGPCAEPIAIGQLLAAGRKTFTSIVAVQFNGTAIKVLPPCGNCRQLLLDYAPNSFVIMATDNKLHKVVVRDLLPFPYKRYIQNE